MLMSCLVAFCIFYYNSEAKASEIYDSDDGEKDLASTDTAQIIELDDSAFSAELIDDSGNIIREKPFIIDLNAQWCGPCRALRPVLEKVQAYYGDKMQIYSVDVDRCPNSCQWFNVQYIPHLAFVDAAGNISEISGGGLTESQLKQYIEQYLKIK